jgi:hypothetical protein
MKEFPRGHIQDFPVTILKLASYESGTREKNELQRFGAFDLSYIRRNRLLISSLYGGSAT